MLKKVLSSITIGFFCLVAVVIVILQVLYQPLTSGVVYVNRLTESIEIMKETDTAIPHVFPSSIEMAAYSIGYMHAQDRLWQLEKTRRSASGTLSEIFGEKALELDKFVRTIGFRRVAEQTYELMDEQDKLYYESYADGVNDFLDEIRLLRTDKSAKLLPPEFAMVGISKMEYWTPVDSLAIMRLVHFYMSMGWQMDLSREFISSLHPDLAEMVEELNPFSTEYTTNLTPQMSNDEARASGFWSDDSLIERYYQSKGKLTKEKKDQLEAQEALLSQMDERRNLRKQQEIEEEEEERLKQEEKQRKRLERKAKKAIEDEEWEAKAGTDEDSQKLEEADQFSEDFAAPSKGQKLEDTAEDEETKKDKAAKKKKEPKPEIKMNQKKQAMEMALKGQLDVTKDYIIVDLEEIALEEEIKRLEAEIAMEAALNKTLEAEASETKEVDLEVPKYVSQEAMKKVTEEDAPKLDEKVDTKPEIPEEKEKSSVQDKTDKKEKVKAEVKEEIKKEIKEEAKAMKQEVEKQEPKHETQKEEKKKEEMKKEQVKEEKASEKKKEEIVKEVKEEKTEQKLSKDQETKPQDPEQKQKQESSNDQNDEPKSKKPKSKKDKKKALSQVEESFIKDMMDFTDQMASNAFAIHGNYTEYGYPMLLSDPHLGAQIPNHWYLMGIHFSEDYVIGATYVGTPILAQGKSSRFAWAQTNSMADLTDVYREQVDYKTGKYLVDGQWRDLKVIKEKIPVKGKQPENFNVYLTHRGPLIEQSKQLRTVQVLFGGYYSSIKPNLPFSFAWTGHHPGEVSLKWVEQLISPDFTVQGLYDHFDSLKAYHGIPAMFTYASVDGEIGSALFAAAPKRKNQTPYSGCFVHDGTSSENDWIEGEFIPTKELPRIRNPQKGYVVAANNRIGLEHVKHDVGQTMVNTARAQRLSELIEKKQQQKQKITPEMLERFQMDVVDVYARNVIGPIVRIAHSHLDLLSIADRSYAEEALSLLDRFRGEFFTDSVAASVYSYWQLYFYQSLFKQYTEDFEERMGLVSHYTFNEFYQRMLLALDQNPLDQHFNKICDKGYDGYFGPKPCAFNIAKAMADTVRYMKTNISPKSENWVWNSLHENVYANIPWSLTYFKPFFHREVSSAGNGNTINVSKYNLKDAIQTMKFKSTHTPTYRQTIHLGYVEFNNTGKYTHEGGQHGNLFGGHYFDMNMRHWQNDRIPMIQSKAEMMFVQHDLLTLKPKNEQAKPKKKSASKLPKVDPKVKTEI